MATYRNTTQPVGCPRAIIYNPANTTNAKIEFERFRRVGVAPDHADVTLNSATITYETDSSKPGFNATTTFALPEGLIVGVSELTYEQYEKITAALFEKISAIQDDLDIAREAYYAAAALQGNNNAPLM